MPKPKTKEALILSLEESGIPADDLIALVKIITREEANRLDSQIKKEKSIDGKIIALLRYLQIPVHFDGYLYIQESIKFLINTPVCNFNSELYPTVAKKFNRKNACIERSSRYIMGYLQDKLPKEKKIKIFGHCRPLTAKEFLCYLVNFINTH